MAISVDSPEESKVIVEKLGLRFPVLADVDSGVTRRYGVMDEDNHIAWPASFLVDRDGRVIWRSLSQTYKVRAGVAEILAAMRAGPPESKKKNHH